MTNWKEINNENQLDEIIKQSNLKPQLIFKHSTRCSISSMAKNRLAKIEDLNIVDLYYLDIIKYRKISNDISKLFGVVHESPQIILIKNTTCIYNESHSGINIQDIIEQVEA